MNKTITLKRLYREYTKKYIRQIFIAVFFSLLVAASTSSIAWLLDPAIEKIFIQKDQSLLMIIPILIIIAFTTKGVSLYLAKIIMINVGEEIKKQLQFNMLNTLISADTQSIDEKQNITDGHFARPRLASSRGIVSGAVREVFWVHAGSNESPSVTRRDYLHASIFFICINQRNPSRHNELFSGGLAQIMAVLVP